MPAVMTSPTQARTAHFERTYRALGRDYGADVEKRTRAAFDQYRRQHPEDELDAIAAEKFPDADFVTVRDVPIFAEHETTDARGRKVRYGKMELAGIVERCNERILDTGDFAPLSDGHTPTNEQAATGAKFPDVLGYCGPFRLGVIGRRKPRFAIFADEHYHKADVDKVRRLPRRSPEVWLEERLQDRILDPIAALGAETPRLDLGMARFRRAGDGREVERYSAISAGVPAMPGGSNTHLPGAVGKKRYDAADTPEQQGTSMLATEDINAIVDAIKATQQWQFLDNLMSQQGGGPDAAMGAGEDSSADPGMPPDAPAAPEPPTATAPTAPAAAPAAAPAQGPSPLSADEESAMPDDEKQQYGAMSHDGKCGYAAARRRHAGASAAPNREQYSRTAAERDALKQENETLREQRRQTDRYSRLGQLAAEHQFDLDDEAAHCRSMSDAQFDAHLTRVRKYARRDDPTAMGYLPTPAIGTTDEPDQKRERYSRRAEEIATASIRGGKHMSYDEAYALAVKEDPK